MKKITDTYRKHAEDFNKKSRDFFSWKFIDKPSLVHMLGKGNHGVILNNQTQALDLACGGGRVIDVLIEQGISSANITGVDTSEVLLESAKSLHTSTQFINADITTYNVFENRFDIATAVHVFAEFDVATLTRTLKNIHKALKVGGTLIYIVGHPLRYINEGGYFNRSVRKQKTPWGAIIKHSNKTIEDYVISTINAGFKIVALYEPEVSESGKIDEQQYNSYTSAPSRLLIVATKS